VVFDMRSPFSKKEDVVIGLDFTNQAHCRLSVDFPYGEVGRVAPFPRMTRTLAAGRIQPSG